MISPARPTADPRFCAYLREVLSGCRTLRGWVPERAGTAPGPALAEAGWSKPSSATSKLSSAPAWSSRTALGSYFTPRIRRLLKIFPGSERLVFLMPFQEPLPL